MQKLRVGKLYTYNSIEFPTLGLWRHKRLFHTQGTRKGSSYFSYVYAGEVNHGEEFIVLTVNNVGEPLILTSKEKVGLIYKQHLQIKEMQADEVKIKL